MVMDPIRNLLFMRTLDIFRFTYHLPPQCKSFRKQATG